MTQDKIKNLISQMTLDEKVGQLQQLSADFFSEDETFITGPKEEFGITDGEIAMVGSVLGISGAETVEKVQKEYLEKSRLKIPLLFMADIIHGYRTIFPIPLAMSQTWNLDLAREIARISAKEASLEGLHVTFSPMMDLVRDPRWGRVLESFGEDTLINTLFSSAMIKGYQNGDGELFSQYTLAATAKHYIGYGLAEAGKEYNTVDISRIRLLEDYMPPFEKAVEDEVALVMTSFNTIDGMPMSGHTELLKKHLRETLGFQGIIISDWNSIEEMVHHRVAQNRKEAAALALDATVDIDMMSFSYHKNLQELIASKEISEKAIDEAVARVLELKFKLGLFDNPYRDLNKELANKYVFSNEHKQVALQAAYESLVLLKNNNQVLPINKQKNVLFMGPLVSSNDLLGSWSWKGNLDETDSISTILEEHENVKTLTLEHIDNDAEAIEKYKSLIDWADDIVVVLGENSEMSGEAASRSEIVLPNHQIEILKKLHNIVNKQVIHTVVIAGRPLDLTDVTKYSQSLIYALFPGTMGAKAIVDTLYGINNPSGKLTMTLPRNLGQVPIYYNYYQTGRPMTIENADPKYVSKYLDVPNSPLFVFGEGYSYSQFEYSNLIVEDEKYAKDGKLKASVQVSNTSNVPGAETIQWYSQDLLGTLIRPEQSLIHFEKVYFEAKETKKIYLEFEIEKLAYVHSDMRRDIESGEMLLKVGGSSRHLIERKYRIEE